MPQVKFVDEKQMPSELDLRIRQELCAAFPVDAAHFEQTRSWHGSFPAFSVVAVTDEAIAAHVGVVDRTVEAAGQRVRIAGIQNVFVAQPFRGQGLSDVVMRAAMEEAGRRGFDGGLLFCLPKIQQVYARVGWQNLGERSVLRIDLGRELPIPDKNIAMYFPLQVPAFPTGVIRLNGNDW